MLCRNCLGALEYAFSRKRGRRYTAEEGPAVETAIVAVCRCPEDGSYSTVYESDIVRNKQYCLGDIRSWFIEVAPTLKDTTEVREALETLQVRMAIKRGSNEELDVLQQIHEQFIEENKVSNVTALAELDEQFHTQICRMAHNPLLLKINQLMAMELKRYRLMSISVKTSSDNTIREHELIIKAIEERDNQKAAAYMLAHLGSSLADINKVLEGQK